MNRNHTELYNNKIFPFFITLLIFTALLNVFPGHYETNDDLGLITILSGKNVFFPDKMTVYLSQLLSYFLYFLYQSFPDISWFGILVYLVTFTGSSLIFGVVIRSTFHNKFIFFICTLLLLFFLSYSILLSSFTSATLILLFGTLLSLLELKVNKSISYHKFYLFFLKFLLLFSFLLRWELGVFIILASPFIFFLQKSDMRQVVIFSLILLCITMLDRAFYSFELNKAGHVEYSEYSHLRGQFHDKINGEYHGDITDKALELTGWKKEDYTFFKLWNIYDNTLFNIHKLKIFLDTNTPELKDNNISIFYNRMKNNFLNNIILNLILFSGILILLIYKLFYKYNMERRNIVILYTTLIILLTSLIFFLYYRYVPRIFIPIFCFFLGTFSLTNISSKKLKNTVFIELVAIPALFIFLSLTVLGIYLYYISLTEQLYSDKEVILYTNKVLEEIDNAAQKELIIIKMLPTIGNSLNFHYINPLQESSINYHKHIKLFPSATQINSPRYFKSLKKLGLKDGHEFLKWTINNNNALLVLFSKNNAMEKQITYYWEKYFNKNITQKEIQIKPKYDFRNNSGVGLVFFIIEEI